MEALDKFCERKEIAPTHFTTHCSVCQVEQCTFSPLFSLFSMTLFNFSFSGDTVGISSVIFIKARIISKTASVACVGTGFAFRHKSHRLTYPFFGYILADRRSRILFEFSAKITDTSAGSEDLLLQCSYRYGVLVLHYTDGSKKLLGSVKTPIMMTYEKTGIPASFVLGVRGTQPEYAKFIT